ncbi:MAG: macro domain-containing protein [Gammaproteobacteria bacterium]|nr:macro domain-containing protein [Gammaproteobacteria bacterium]
MAIRFVLGDITGATTDAIVNAANPVMLGGGGVDGAIHRAAGPALLKACQAVAVKDGVRCPPGEARITPAGNLPAKFVIHTVGPLYHQDPHPAQTLASAYQQSCRLAIYNGCQSVAFPAISCGVYGYPHKEAASVAINACLQFSGTLKIDFYLFNQTLYDCFVSQWQTIQQPQQQ